MPEITIFSRANKRRIVSYDYYEDSWDEYYAEEYPDGRESEESDFDGEHEDEEEHEEKQGDVEAEEEQANHDDEEEEEDEKQEEEDDDDDDDEKGAEETEGEQQQEELFEALVCVLVRGILWSMRSLAADFCQGHQSYEWSTRG